MISRVVLSMTFIHPLVVAVMICLPEEVYKAVTVIAFVSFAISASESGAIPGIRFGIVGSLSIVGIDSEILTCTGISSKRHAANSKLAQISTQAL